MSATGKQTSDGRWQGFELLPDATVVLDAGGVVVAGNGLAARLLGIEQDALVGSHGPAVLPLHDEVGLDWWESQRPLEEDARILPRIPERDLQLQGAAGKQRPVALTGVRHLDAGGHLDVLVLSLRRGERRQRLDAARSELVSTVSHELRSPLTSVKGFTKTLLAKWDRFTDEQKRHMLATVNEDADRVTRLLSELLDVSRIDAGRLQLHRQLVDLAAVVQRVVERAGADVARDRIASDLPTLPRFYADPDKLEQVLTNLVENGLAYGEGTVRVSAVLGEHELLVTVSDEGKGIAQSHLQHVFTKFFRPAGERRTGTGLGLYICKGIVEAHGGCIWASSPPGEGASLCFTLPRGGLELAGISQKDYS